MIILEPTAVDEVLALALGEVGSRPGDVTIDIPAGIPLVVADPVLLQRVVVNLATNAIRFACDGVPPASGCGISRTRMLGGSMMGNVRMAGRAQGSQGIRALRASE